MKPTARHALWLRWSCATLDDRELAGCSILARHIYDRGLLMVKRAGTDGLLDRRQIMAGLLDDDGLAPVRLAPGSDGVTGTMVNAAIEELVRAALVKEIDGAQAVEITAWFIHNRPVEDGSGNGTAETAVKTAQQRSAHRTNHKRGFHADKPNPDCEFCQVSTVDRDGSDTGTAPVPNGPRAVAEHEQSREKEAPRSTQEGPEAEPGGVDFEDDGGIPGTVELAHQAHRAMGYPPDSPPSSKLVEATRTARGRGWTPQQILDVAAEAITRPEVQSPAGWFAKKITSSLPPRPGPDPDGATPIQPVRPLTLARPHPTDCPGGCDDDGLVDTDVGLAQCTGQPIEATA